MLATVALCHLTIRESLQKHTKASLMARDGQLQTKLFSFDLGLL